jgi:hypothetical protein
LPEQAPTCGTDGALIAEIYGGVRAPIDWSSGVLERQGMPRPNGEGARLRFAGPAGNADGDQRHALLCGTAREPKRQFEYFVH